MSVRTRFPTFGPRFVPFVPLLIVLAAACGPAMAPADGAAPFFSGVGLDGAPLVVARRPERVLPANTHAAEIVAALVPRARLAGVPVTVFEFGAGFGAREEWEPGRVLTSYRGEAVLALAPDLVVSGAYQDLDTTALLRRAGVPVVGLPTVRRYEDVVDAIELLGAVVGEPSTAARLVRDMATRRDALAARATARRARFGDSSALVYTNYGTGGWTQGADSPAEVLLELAGLSNAAAEGGRNGHYQIDAERLLDLDPGFVVCGAEVSGLGASAAFLRADPVLARLSAVAGDRVVVLPAEHFQASSQHLLDAAEALADAVEERLERALEGR